MIEVGAGVFGSFFAAVMIIGCAIVCAWLVSAVVSDVACRTYFRHKLEFTKRLMSAKHGGK